MCCIIMWSVGDGSCVYLTFGKTNEVRYFSFNFRILLFTSEIILVSLIMILLRRNRLILSFVCSNTSGLWREER